MNIKHSNDVRRLTKKEMKQVNGGWSSGPCGPGQPGFNMPCPLRGNPNHVVCCTSVADCQLANIQLCWVA